MRFNRPRNRRSPYNDTLDGLPVIVSGEFDGTIKVRDLASGTPRGELLRGHKGMVRSVALAALEGRSMVVSGGEDGTVRVWDLASRKPRGKPLCGHKDEVSSVALATLDGRPVIVSGGFDGTVRVWDLASRKPRGDSARSNAPSRTSLTKGQG